MQPTRKSAKDVRMTPKRAESKYHVSIKPSIKLTNKPMPPGRPSIADRKRNKRLLSIAKGWIK